MRFTFKDKLYSLQFHRKYQKVKFYEKGEPITQMSMYPFTIVTLLERVPPAGPDRGILVVTVGCLPADGHNFSNEEGRKQALKALTRRLSKMKENGVELYPSDFRAAMWDAYMNRAKTPIVEAESVAKVEETLNPQRLLPAAEETRDAYEAWG